MILFSFALAAVLQVAEAPPFEPPMVTVSMAISDFRNWGRPIQICSHVVAGRGPGGASVMYGYHDWLYVRTEGPPLTPGTPACVRGVILRSDGYTEEEADRLVISGGIIVDAADPLRVLYECTSLDRCQSLIRNGHPTMTRRR